MSANWRRFEDREEVLEGVLLGNWALSEGKEREMEGKRRGLGRERAWWVWVLEGVREVLRRNASGFRVTPPQLPDFNWWAAARCPFFASPTPRELTGNEEGDRKLQGFFWLCIPLSKYGSIPYTV